MKPKKARTPNVGGRRPGAGRPKGVPNKVNRELREKVAASGLSMIEIMTTLARDHFRDYQTERRKSPKLRDDEKMMAKSRAALEAAEKAAPYLHPRHAAVQHTGKDGGPIQHQAVDLTKLSDAQLAALEPVFAALAGAPGGDASPDPGGASEAQD